MCREPLFLFAIHFPPISMAFTLALENGNDYRSAAHVTNENATQKCAADDEKYTLRRTRHEQSRSGLGREPGTRNVTLRPTWSSPPTFRLPRSRDGRAGPRETLEEGGADSSSAVGAGKLARCPQRKAATILLRKLESKWSHITKNAPWSSSGG